MYKAIAYDPEVHAPRVYGIADTENQARLQCRYALHEYLIGTRRWDEFNPEDFEIKITITT